MSPSFGMCCRLYRSWRETGFEEINRNVLQPDFWPRIVSGCAVILPGSAEPGDEGKSGGQQLMQPDLTAAQDIAIVIVLAMRLGLLYIPELMLDSKGLAAIRARLGLSQEQMARLLGVSFASVNRWEAGHSSPTGPTMDLYNALTAAIRAGHSPEAIRHAANAERGAFLLALFQMGYAKSRRPTR